MLGRRNTLRNDLHRVQLRILDQFADEFEVSSQNLFDLLWSLIAAPQPDDFGRRTVQPAPLGEVGILRNDSVSVGLGILPDLPIVRLLQTRSANVRRVRKEIAQSGRKSMAQILVEQQLHAADPTK